MTDAAPTDLSMRSGRSAVSLSGQFRKIREFIIELNLLQYSYILFISSYFIAPYERVYKFSFYFVVLPLFFLSIDRRILELVRSSRVFLLCIVWLGYLSLTLFWTDDVRIRDIDDVLRGYVLLTLFFAVTIHLAHRDAAFPRRLFVWLAATAALTAVVSIAQFYSVHEFPGPRLVSFGVLNNPVTAANCYSIVALITLYGLLGRDASRQQRWIYAAILAVLLIFVLLTASRGAMLALMVAALVGAAASRRWRLAFGLVTICLAFAAFGIMGPLGEYDLLARGSSYRLEIWSAIWGRITDGFWLGNGIGADETVVMADGLVVRHAHQLFLGNHFYGGVPATVLLLSVLAAAARVAYRRIRIEGDALCATLLTFVVVAGSFDFGEFLRSANLIWFYFWFPVALIAGQEVAGERNDRGQAPERV